MLAGFAAGCACPCRADFAGVIVLMVKGAAWTGRSTKQPARRPALPALALTGALAFGRAANPAKNGQPWPGSSPGRGCRWVVRFGKRTCKPNSVVCGHSSRRRVAADVHQRPTRRFRRLHRAAQESTAQRKEPPGRTGPVRNAAWLYGDDSLPIWSCSVWGLPCPRRYRRSGALLPHHFTLTPALNQQADSGSSSRKRGSRGGIFSVALAVHEP